MKTSLRFALIAMAMTSFGLHAEGYLTHRVFDVPRRSEPLPSKLSFKAGQVKVRNISWFASLFNAHSCEAELGAQVLKGDFEITVRADHSMNISWNGKASKYIGAGHADYIPIYRHLGVLVHPHFLIKLPNWVTIFVQVHRNSDETKTFELSLVQNRPGQEIKLLPILEGAGI